MEPKRGRRPAEQTNVRTRVAAWRVRRGLTQEELAEMAHVSRSTLTRLERGEHEPRVDVLLRLSLALGCELNDLIDPEWWTWWNRSMLPTAIRESWRGVRSGGTPTPDEAPAEIDRLVKSLPRSVRLGDADVVVARAEVGQLRAAAFELDLAAIVSADPDEFDRLRAQVVGLERLARLRVIVPPATDRQARLRRRA